MIKIDGTYGEGGGQILRTSLSLSAITKQPFIIENIRGNRGKTGLLRQHLTAVNSIVEITNGNCLGNYINSDKLHFEPGDISGGDYFIDIGSAGSANLVIETILYPLLFGKIRSKIKIKGGTHNMSSPPFHFLKYVLLPILKNMGFDIDIDLMRYGFYPAGGGKINFWVKPFEKELKDITPLKLLKRGELKKIEAISVISKLASRIAFKELTIVGKELNIDKKNWIMKNVDSPGPGNVLMVKVDYENITELFSSFGAKGTPLEKVAKDLIEESDKYIKNDIVVGEYLADQLLIPLALAKKGEFISCKPSKHTETNIKVIEDFTAVKIKYEKINQNRYRFFI